MPCTILLLHLRNWGYCCCCTSRLYSTTMATSLLRAIRQQQQMSDGSRETESESKSKNYTKNEISIAIFTIKRAIFVHFAVREFSPFPFGICLSFSVARAYNLYFPPFCRVGSLGISPCSAVMSISRCVGTSICLGPSGPPPFDFHVYIYVCPSTNYRH